jgi:putative copper export protein/methionine-rich copper-binding protein CopC
MLRRFPIPSVSWVLLLLVAAAVPPVAAHVHIRLDESSPGPDEVLSSMPTQLRLLFSGAIEARYTSVTLLRPDGARVQMGDIVFRDGSDREITLRLPALVQPGRYTVRWRTAGSDGHVLEGSYAFVLAPDSAAAAAGAAPGDTAVAAPGTVAPHAAAPAVDQAHPHHDEPQSVGAVRGVIGRGLHFLALFLLLGGVTFRALLLPRLALNAGTRALLERRTWRMIAAAALLLALAAVLRLWFQSISLHGADRAWNTLLLSIMLTDTSWGRAWLLQAFLFALLGMAIVWARPGRDRAGVVVAVGAVLGLSTIPALSGHAAGPTGVGRLLIVNDALHVAAAGAWLGTLALLALIAIPAIRRLEPDGAAAAADAIDSFSPLALTGGAIVLFSGVVNSVVHLNSPTQLWTTGYGRALLVKLVLVGGVGLAGLVNWRLVRPVLRERDGMRRLKLSATAELVFAFLVLTATAVLTGQRP